MDLKGFEMPSREGGCGIAREVEGAPRLKISSFPTPQVDCRLH